MGVVHLVVTVCCLLSPCVARAVDIPEHGLSSNPPGLLVEVEEGPNRNFSVAAVADGLRPASEGVNINLRPRFGGHYSPPPGWKRVGYVIWVRCSGEQFWTVLYWLNGQPPYGEEITSYTRIPWRRWHDISFTGNNAELYEVRAYTLWRKWTGSPGEPYVWWPGRPDRLPAVPPTVPAPYARDYRLVRVNAAADASIDSRVLTPGDELEGGMSINANFGSSTYNGGLFVGHFHITDLPYGKRKLQDMSGLARLLLRFDISSTECQTALGSSQRSVCLVLGYSGTPAGFENEALDPPRKYYELLIRKIAAQEPPWAESTVTWENAPAPDWGSHIGRVWMEPNPPKGVVSTEITIESPPPTLLEFMVVLPNDSPNWKTEPPLHPHWRYFHSKEYIGDPEDPSSARPPHLWILYYVPQW